MWAGCRTRLQGWSNMCKRKGGETSVIDDNNGESDRTTKMGMVATGKDAVVVVSVRGP